MEIDGIASTCNDKMDSINKSPSSVPPINLRKLLDSAVAEHKKDIHAYSWGHLNESRLFKLSETSSTRRYWATSVNQPLSNQSNKLDLTRSPKYTFLPNKDSEDCLEISKTRSAAAHANRTVHEVITVTDISEVDDKTEKQDINAEGFKLPDIQQRVGFVPSEKRNKRTIIEDSPPNETSPRVLPGDQSPRNLSYCVPRHLDAVTRSEEYKEMKNFVDTVRKSNAPRRDVLHTTQTVEELTQKLEQV